MGLQKMCTISNVIKFIPKWQVPKYSSIPSLCLSLFAYNCQSVIFINFFPFQSDHIKRLLLCYARPNKLFYLDPCMVTQEVDQSLRKCIFPFSVLGNANYKCILKFGNNQNWCSTNVDINGNHITGGGSFGYCGPECPYNWRVNYFHFFLSFFLSFFLLLSF